MSLPKELFLAKILPLRKPMAFLRGRTLNFDNFRSGGPHSKAFGLQRGRQKARIFVYPVGKRSFSFGARPRFLPRSERKAFYYWGSAAEFRVPQGETHRDYFFKAST